MIERVTSSSNPAIKRARALQSRRRERYREAAFVVEGIRSLTSLVDAGAAIRVLFLDDRIANQQPLPPDIARIADAAGRTLSIPPALVSVISDAETPSGVAAVVEMPRLPFPRNAGLVVALDGVQDPGNLGTILRTAAAAGADGVALLPGSVDPYNPKVVRGAAGTLATIPIQPFRRLEEITDAAFSTPPQIVVADANGAVDYDDIDWTQATLLIAGSEGAGPRETTLARADIVARIPIRPDVESLNVAVATAVMLFEASRQRRKST